MDQAILVDVFGKRPMRLETLTPLVTEYGGDASSIVLEVGCGMGDGIAHLNRVLGCRCFGLDKDGNLLRKAAGRHGQTSSLAFIAGSVYAIGQKNNCVDIVVSDASFSLLKNKAAAAGEYHRILKPGGRLIIRDFASLEPVAPEDRSKIDHIPCFQRVGTLLDYEIILGAAGFKVLKREISTKELIRTALYLSRAFNEKMEKISHLFARIMNADTAKGESGKCFFQNNRLGFCELISQKSI